MAVGHLKIVIILAVTTTLATAQSDCTNVLISMSPCLNYISGNSSTPSAGCCTQLGTVVRSQPQCLCQVINGGGPNLGLNINQTQALALPAACNVKTPPVTQCNSGPSGSPVGSSTPNSPNTNTAGDGSSKTLPSGNAAAATRMPLSFPFLPVVVVSYVFYLA